MLAAFLFMPLMAIIEVNMTASINDLLPMVTISMVRTTITKLDHQPIELADHTQPNGSVYRDDDGGGSLRPLVKIASTPNSGWYTVQVAHYLGAPTNANFTLKYGRYNAGNINCSGGTVPVSSGIEPGAYKAQSVAPVVAPKAADAP